MCTGDNGQLKRPPRDRHGLTSEWVLITRCIYKQIKMHATEQMLPSNEIYLHVH